MTTLITGSNGFIGQHLINYLLEKKYHLDEAIYLLVRNNNKLNRYRGYKIKIITIDDLYKNNLKFDSIIHLAGKAHDKCFDKEDIKKNYTFSKQLLSYSKNIKLSKFIFISTIKVYGEENIKDRPHLENDTPRPMSNYSISKFQIENEIVNSFKNNLTKYFILRIPLVIGPGAKGNLFALIKLLNKGLPLPFDKISNKRSFISISNLVNQIFNILNQSNLKSGIYNLSDNSYLSSTDLINFINNKLNKKSNIFYLNRYILLFLLFLINKNSEYRKIFSSQILDNNKSIKLLNFSEVINTEKEINNMVNYYQKKI